MPRRNENHQVGVNETTLPTKDYEDLVWAAEERLVDVEKRLRDDPDAADDYRIKTALEQERDRIKAALGRKA